VLASNITNCNLFDSVITYMQVRVSKFAHLSQFKLKHILTDHEAE